jgi:hypothetical protein
VTYYADDAYERGHEDGFNAGYEAAQRDGVKGTVAPAPESGLMTVKRVIPQDHLALTAGREANIEVRRDPMNRTFEVEARAESLAGLAHVLTALGSAVASMEGSVRASMAGRGPQG